MPVQSKVSMPKGHPFIHSSPEAVLYSFEDFVPRVQESIAHHPTHLSEATTQPYDIKNIPDSQFSEVDNGIGIHEDSK
ncbi:hypothetical protein DPMN_035527 [Dreissena polymorpha]|uniref:Uncharacterized protein n=1 Tax=Dreissena polymorpha TaxID=45954 RepID=A0A9D4RMZ6_DREPO|nr:hypothetical protein DPMN_035527 [Dreissena polymorpha]